jgi:hypothetical protein
LSSNSLRVCPAKKKKLSSFAFVAVMGVLSGFLKMRWFQEALIGSGNPVGLAAGSRPDKAVVGPYASDRR